MKYYLHLYTAPCFMQTSSAYFPYSTPCFAFLLWKLWFMFFPTSGVEGKEESTWSVHQCALLEMCRVCGPLLSQRKTWQTSQGTSRGVFHLTFHPLLAEKFCFRRIIWSSVEFLFSILWVLWGALAQHSCHSCSFPARRTNTFPVQYSHLPKVITVFAK